MYQKVGERLNEPLPDFPFIWNPPGWGSYSSLDILPHIFPNRKLAMVVGIKPGGFIPFHVDNPAAENAVSGPLTRLHVVLVNNNRCWNFHDGVWQQLEVGGVYEMDPFKEHASINLGDSTRIHLVVDI